MIGRRFSRKTDKDEVEPRGFDDFDIRLGDLMRGERATLGKSLLDVERELRIKAAYVAAIENAAENENEMVELKHVEEAGRRVTPRTKEAENDY